MSPDEETRTEAARPDPGEDPNRGAGRVFLVVVDESPEMDVALRFACRRARHTGGRVALLYVTEPSEFQNWLTVGELMRDEARHQGEQVLQRLAGKVNEWVGRMPVLYLREGNRRDELFEADRQRARDFDPGAGRLHRQGRARSAGRRADRQVCRQAARAGHHRARQPVDRGCRFAVVTTLRIGAPAVARPPPCARRSRTGRFLRLKWS